MKKTKILFLGFLIGFCSIVMFSSKQAIAEIQELDCSVCYWNDLKYSIGSRICMSTDVSGASGLAECQIGAEKKPVWVVISSSKCSD